MKKLCVFCGSSEGRSDKWMSLAKQLGRELVDQSWGLVYGGASIGLMGAMADACIEKEGKVWGVIPKAILDKEIAHAGLEQLYIVDDMHQRKQKMYDLSEAFLALPGGFGTLDELFEILTWSQLGLHKKKIYLLNVDGFYDGIIQHVNTMYQEHFVKQEHKNLLQVVSSYQELFSGLNRVE
ncbi:MAG: TIGR00730 family Rossman fold protein [Bacteriovoracaceae bacterium]